MQKPARKQIRPRDPGAKSPAGVFVVGIEPERYYNGHRYHWTLSAAEDLDQLVSWGHAPTRALAEAAAQTESDRLKQGLTRGGRVVHRKKRIES